MQTNANLKKYLQCLNNMGFEDKDRINMRWFCVSMGFTNLYIENLWFKHESKFSTQFKTLSLYNKVIQALRLKTDQNKR